MLHVIVPFRFPVICPSVRRPPPAHGNEHNCSPRKQEAATPSPPGKILGLSGAESGPGLLGGNEFRVCALDMRLNIIGTSRKIGASSCAFAWVLLCISSCRTPAGGAATEWTELPKIPLGNGRHKNCTYMGHYRTFSTETATLAGARFFVFGLASSEAKSPQAAASESHNPGIARLPVT